MKIIYDTMGGDKAPEEILAGALLAEKNLNIEPVFVGQKESIIKELKDQGIDPMSYEIIASRSLISNEEEPVMAIRKKKDSSMVMGLEALANDDQYQGFISCGSTGALLAGGTFIIKRLDHVKRPPISAIIPTKENPILLVDAGANVDLSADILLQFALMGHSYMKNVMDIEKPKIGLLNIGSEEGKGNQVSKQAYQLLKDHPGLNFAGNIEANQVPFGGIDVLVTDGFAGNVLLKTYEGVADMFLSLIKPRIKKIKNPLALVSIKNNFSDLKEIFDYSDYGGAPLLGLQKPVFKAHGKSDAKSILGASMQIYRYIEADVVSIMADNISESSSKDLDL